MCIEINGQPTNGIYDAMHNFIMTTMINEATDNILNSTTFLIIQSIYD